VEEEGEETLAEDFFSPRFFFLVGMDQSKKMLAKKGENNLSRAEG